MGNGDREWEGGPSSHKHWSKLVLIKTTVFQATNQYRVIFSCISLAENTINKGKPRQKPFRVLGPLPMRLVS